MIFSTLAAAGVATNPASTPPNPEWVQETATPKRGVYLERTGDPALEPLHASLASDSKVSGTAKAMFGMRPTVTLIIAGTTAALRLDTNEPAFRIVLTGTKQNRSQMPDLAAFAEMADAPTPMAKEGKEFVLARLLAQDSDRAVDVKKGKVPATVEKMADDVFRLRPSRPLDAGEYAICHVASGMPTGQVWDFGLGAR